MKGILTIEDNMHERKLRGRVVGNTGQQAISTVLVYLFIHCIQKCVFNQTKQNFQHYQNIMLLNPIPRFCKILCSIEQKKIREKSRKNRIARQMHNALLMLASARTNAQRHFHMQNL